MNYKYKSLSDFKKAHPSEYRHLLYKGLLEQLCHDMCWEFFKLTPRNYWTKETCLLEARKYKTRSEWGKTPDGGASSYNSAKQNGWFDECVAHMVEINKPRNYWTKETCLVEARKYKSRAEWNKAPNSSYNSAKQNGWFDECVAHMVEKITNGHWQIKENCIAEARKYKTRAEWGKAPDGGASSYLSAKQNGWFNECVAHMKYAHTPANYWTKKRVLEEIKKYDSYTKWISESPSSRVAAKRDGYLDECLKILPKTRKSWTKEACLEEALKYKKISEWQKNSNGSLKAARRNNWLTECVTHMK